MGDVIDEDALAIEFDSLVDGDDDVGMPELADAPAAEPAAVSSLRANNSIGAVQEDAAQNDERAALLASMQ